MIYKGHEIQAQAEATITYWLQDDGEIGDYDDIYAEDNYVYSCPGSPLFDDIERVKEWIDGII